MVSVSAATATERTAMIRRLEPVGESLAAVLERHGVRQGAVAELPWLLGIVLQVCDVAIREHARGRMHCDVAPCNVLIDSSGQVSMLEARFLSGDGLRSTEYMAPEQAWGRCRDFDARTDVYGIGGIVYAILTRAPPHRAASSSAALVLARAGAIRAPQELCAGRALPSELCRIVERALSASPSDRHPSVALLKQEIERFMCGTAHALPARALPMRVPAAHASTGSN
jgi:serine/threonine protein kinase